MNTIEKITDLINHSGKSVSSIFKELKIPHNAVSEWSKGKAKPSAEALTKIADYFDVSVDYLLGRTNTQIFQADEKKEPTSENVSFERLREALSEKGLTEQDVENLSDEKLTAIADIIKNFKQ